MPIPIPAGLLFPAGEGPGHPVDPDYGHGHPLPPVASQPLPPLPGINPPPGKPPIIWPLPPLGPVAMPPIFIPEPPDHPLPPVLWPPLPPETGLPSGKVAILIWVVGVGYRWLIYDQAMIDNTLPGGGHIDNTLPPTPGPK